MKGSRRSRVGLHELATRSPFDHNVSGGHSVPYLHQVVIVDGYDTPEPLPQPIASNAHAARAACPDASYWLWNGHQLRAFLSQRFDRDVLTAFDALAPYSYKCDLARFCLLYEYGGIYVDLGVRLMAPWSIPFGRRVAAFRDLPITSSWTAMQTGLLWAQPGQREFALAIDLILDNVRTHYYGSGPLHPTGPVVLGKAMLAARIERGWEGQDPQHVGECRPLTPGLSIPNMGYISPEGTLVALRTKLVPGDVEHLGITRGNNYNQLWRSRRVYGERTWSWTASDSGNPAAESVDTSDRLRLGTSGTLMSGAYEALFVPADPSFAGEVAVLVQSRSGGDGEVKLQSCGAVPAETPVPFEVIRREDEIDCWIEAPGEHVAGSVTIREARVRHWAFDDPQIRLSKGIRTETGIVVAAAARGLVSFGPYTTIYRGKYRLEATFENISSGFGFLNLEVSSDAGERRLASTAVSVSRLASSGLISLSFECETDVQNVEFRVSKRFGAHALLTCFTLTRLK